MGNGIGVVTHDAAYLTTAAAAAYCGFKTTSALRKATAAGAAAAGASSVASRTTAAAGTTAAVRLRGQSGAGGRVGGLLVALAAEPMLSAARLAGVAATAANACRSNWGASP